MNITAGLGVAVREFPLTTGFADYMLYADAKAIGSVEAKPKASGLWVLPSNRRSIQLVCQKCCRIGKCHFHLLTNPPELNVDLLIAKT